MLLMQNSVLRKLIIYMYHPAALVGVNPQTTLDLFDTNVPPQGGARAAT